MFENQTHRTPTDAEKSILTTYAAGDGMGKTNAQMAAELNDATRTVANPAPIDPAKAIPLPVILKSAAQDLLTAVITELMGVSTPNAVLIAKYQYIQTQVNAHDGDYQLATVQPYAAAMIADNLITQTQVAELTTSPDPTYQPVIPAGPLAFQLFGQAVVVEASDFA